MINTKKCQKIKFLCQNIGKTVKKITLDNNFNYGILVIYRSSGELYAQDILIFPSSTMLP
jgi:hypothetical protein